MKFTKWLQVFFLIVISTIGVNAVAGVIKVHSLHSKPVMDAVDDWSEIPFTSIKLKSIQTNSVETRTIRIKAAVHADQIYLFACWNDDKPSHEHKPYLWNKEASRYTTGPEREDRLAIQFEMEGDYTTNWPAAKYFKADMWHWKSSRSAPLNLMHDKYTVVSTEKMTRSRKLKTADGKQVYIKRLSDKGVKLYNTLRYGGYKGDKLPKYILNNQISGSIADVKARSVWKKGKWCLEINRALDTGHNDDVKFVSGRSLKAGIAVFDNSSDNEHFISATLDFVL